jgi:hypothetical protein
MDLLLTGTGLNFLKISGSVNDYLAIARPIGAPLAVDDFADADTGEAAFLIDVLANDSGDSLTLLDVEIISGGGSVAIVSNQIQFTPPGSADTTVISYRASNIVGSDLGTLTVTTSDAPVENTPDFGDSPTSSADDGILLLKTIGF